MAGVLARPNKAQAHQVRTVSKTRLGGPVATLPESLLEELERALRLHLDL